ncbi:MAG: hypothetical protein SFY69_05920 [Planctomycetota bacterium]|nr:hypothetical protein [Planctomycetota bacterium]
MRSTLAVLLASLAAAGAAHAQSTAFTYQGELADGGIPASGAYDIRFRLFDAATDGTQVGTTVCVDNVAVTNGRFTTTIDFGQQFAVPSARFLQIEVRADTGLTCTNTTGFSVLSPRQLLTATPLASHAKSAFALDAADGSPANAVLVDNNGRVGIGTTTPGSLLHVFGNRPELRLQDDDLAGSFAQIDDQSAGQMRINKVSTATISFIDINPQITNGINDVAVRFFRETNTTGIRRVLFHAGNNSAATSAEIGVGGRSSYFQVGGGNFGIGTALPATNLHITKLGGIPNGGPVIVLQDTGGNSTQSGYLGFWNGSGAETGWIGYGTPGSPHMTMINTRAGGDIFITPAAGRAVKVPVLEITGADLAEKFPASETLEPGTVVAIDPDNVGQLCMSRGAYNTRVAGVVSGANNFSVGAVLGNLPGHEDAPAIALSGRVYVRCDAATGAIEPGDLLTTSDTPGHAMKATDRDRANGAILGKAMQRLEKGERGLVLVLVNLQ